MKLGILDFGSVDENSNALETIHHTISNSQLAEQKGYSRYWLAEHYTNNVAWRNVDIMLTLIAGYTDIIKIGSAGIKINLYSSMFQVAQNYKTLSTLFSNRVDLGFARSFESKEITDIITDTSYNLDFKQRIQKLNKLFNNEFEDVVLVPFSKIQPDMWMLGNSNSMLEFTIENKMNFSLSLFHQLNSPLPDSNIIRDLKKSFYEKNGFQPQTNIAISVFCHESKKRIEEEIASRNNVTLNVYGNPEECKQKIQDLLDMYEVDEAIMLNLGSTNEERGFLIENVN
jgi:luciferase family oxidoreductase group 1